MRELLDLLLADIKKRVRAEDPTAAERAARLAERYPDEPKVWRMLAHAHALNGDMDGAVAAMTRMKDVSPPEPMIFFHRGRYEQDRGNPHAALDDFDQGIEISEQHHFEYYLETLHFFRADVLAGLGRKAEARAALAHVRDDFVTYTTKMRSKADILADCRE